MMLRFYKQDLSHDITVTRVYEPPKIPLAPRARRTAIVSTTNLATEAIYDTGIRPTRTVRFASSETQGFLTQVQAKAIIALYEAGGSFLIETDLLEDAWTLTPKTYTAFWEPDAPPEFLPAANAQLYFMDILVRVREVV